MSILMMNEFGKNLNFEAKIMSAKMI